MKQIRFDFVMCSAIALLALGGLGGSLQPSRLMLLAFGLPAAALLIARGSLCGVRLGAVLMGLTIMFGATLSLAWSPVPAEGIGLLLVVAVGLLAVPIACVCKVDLATARRVRDAWSWAMVATLPLALYELTTGAHFAFALEDRNVGGDVGAVPFASIFFGNFNNYCAFICLALPMMFGTLEASRFATRRWFWATCIALAYLILAVNTNRLSMVFAAVLLLYYLVTRRSWRLPFALATSLAGFALSFGHFMDDIESLLLLANLKFEGLGTADESVDQRARIIAAGIAQLRDSFGLGFGPGSFEHHLRLDHPDLIPNAHNLIIELATNFGGVAALGFMLFLGQLFVTTWRSELPRDLRAIALVTVPFVPAIGAINSQAVAYSYWWLWLATVTVIAAAAGERRARGRVIADAHALDTTSASLAAVRSFGTTGGIP